MPKMMRVVIVFCVRGIYTSVGWGDTARYAYTDGPCGVRMRGRVCVCGGAGAVRHGDKAESPKGVTRIRGFVLGAR